MVSTVQAGRHVHFGTGPGEWGIVHAGSAGRSRTITD